MFTVDRRVPVNADAGEPTLTRAQVWRGLVMKAENAVPFVPAMTLCEVVERRENQLVREIVLRGQRLTERVTFYPERMVKFERLSGGAMGTILNEIAEDERDGLCLRFTFTLGVESLAPGSAEEKEFAKVMEADYLTTMSATVKIIRHLVREGGWPADDERHPHTEISAPL